MAYALSELLKGQLELTANFLSSQKSLYSTYCASLSKIVQKPANHDEHDKVKSRVNINFEPRIHLNWAFQILYPREYKEALEVKEKPEGPKAEDYEYESEFESASSDDDTIVPTELSTE